MHQQQQQVQPQFTFEGGHLVMFHQQATGLPSVVDANVNDRDRVMDLLISEKHLSNEYNIAMAEASHDQLFQIFKKNHETVHQIQRQIWNTAFKKGWYRLPVADAQSVVTAFNKMQQRRGEFPTSAGQQSQWQGAQQMQMQQQMQNQQQMQQQQMQQQQMQQQMQQQQMQNQQMQNQQQAQGLTQQQLNRQVDRAIRDAQQGHVPGVNRH